MTMSDWEDRIIQDRIYISDFDQLIMDSKKLQ